VSCSLEEAALVLARQEYPDIDPSPWLQRLDAHAALAQALLSERPDTAEIVGAVNDVLFRDLGFRGNEDDYYDPKNSFLNDVIERRTGIPISLSAVYMAVAGRVGLALQGTAFPGHFLIVHQRPGWPIVIDAFGGGRILLREDCERLLERAGVSSWDERFLAPVPKLAILRRMLNNLKGIYLSRRDWPRLLRTSNQIFVVTPDEHDEHFTRGLALAGMGASPEAISELERYLQQQPEAGNRDEVLDLLSELRRRSKPPGA
jgi:regulator of sirC expression with transglutaminase-like and TPR domain